MLVPSGQASLHAIIWSDRPGDLKLKLEWALASSRVWPCCLWCGCEGPAGLLVVRTPPLSSMSSRDAPADVHVEEPRENLTVSHPFILTPVG